jgi:alpha-galactosidase
MKGHLPRRVTRLDSLVLDLLPASYDLRAYTGAWGAEFEPQSMPLTSPVILESRSGRSSHGHHPWFALVCDGRSIISGAVAWSGNWAIRLMPRPEEAVALSAGLHDWEFAVDLVPGASVEAPPVVLVFARGDDLDEAAVQFARLGRRFWYPRNALADRLPVEWNHWWAYEDRALDEATFRANVDAAARMGIEVCTLDAGVVWRVRCWDALVRPARRLGDGQCGAISFRHSRACR